MKRASFIFTVPSFTYFVFVSAEDGLITGWNMYVPATYMSHIILLTIKCCVWLTLFVTLHVFYDTRLYSKKSTYRCQQMCNSFSLVSVLHLKVTAAHAVWYWERYVVNTWWGESNTVLRTIHVIRRNIRNRVCATEKNMPQIYFWFLVYLTHYQKPDLASKDRNISEMYISLGKRQTFKFYITNYIILVKRYG
jgi:hypothetical protein